MVKTCCITGHRDMSEEQTEKIRPVLKEKIIKALLDSCDDLPGHSRANNHAD